MYYVLSFLQYHFTADMWEKPRIDGKIKLKHNAIPTIFGDLVYQVKNKGVQGQYMNCYYYCEVQSGNYYSILIYFLRTCQ